MPKLVATQVRLPREIHKLLSVQAKRHLRSRNSELIKILAAYFNIETEEKAPSKVTRLKALP